MAAESNGHGLLFGHDGETALRSLTIVERFLCKRLIARQFIFQSTVERNIDKYGLEGTVKLYSARAIFSYLFVLTVVAAALAVAGENTASIFVFAVSWLGFLLFVARIISATGAAKRWRVNGR